MLLGAIADDFTGASDLANTLAKGGMATVQYVGIPTKPADPACEAGVVALKTRSIAPAEAVRQSLAALDWLSRQGCRQYVFKYCSTFDSTPEGNIGPVAEALIAALDAPVAVVCPAYPAVGRTIFMGHLFVKDRLLSESGMEKHPLTPMTDPDLRRWLRRQTQGDVGLVSYSIVRQGSEAISRALDAEAAAARRLVVVDAVTEDDLLEIGRALARHRLVTGGSGIALGLPENFRKAGLLSNRRLDFTPTAGPGIVLSGSCSSASQEQVGRYLEKHPGLLVNPCDLIEGSLTIDDAVSFAIAKRMESPMIYSTADPSRVAEIQSRWGKERVAQAVEDFFAALSDRLVAEGFVRVVVGGGETSGAVVTALGLGELQIGPEIDDAVSFAIAKRMESPMIYSTADP
ncbi:MAG: 3-oxo-tetronate kinase, partial [Hyphomicrobiales bacterium]